MFDYMDCTIIKWNTGYMCTQTYLAALLTTTPVYQGSVRNLAVAMLLSRPGLWGRKCPPRMEHRHRNRHVRYLPVPLLGHLVLHHDLVFVAMKNL